MRFERFAAIDWSGAKGVRHKGIAVAVADAGDAAPSLVRPGDVWSRGEVVEWLRGLAGGPPTLAGMDFSFAPPFLQRGAYLPGDDTPDTAKPFWAFVDQRCDDADLGAAAFLEQHFRRHFYFGKADGHKAGYMHFRACETAFNKTGGGKASTVYDAIGASQVAKASFAGMRLLHRVNDVLPVWPFDARPDSGSVLVEIYCRAFIRIAGLPGLKVRTLENLNSALSSLGSQPVQGERRLSNDETDVLVTAAGLRHIAHQPQYWSPAGIDAARHTEGWTFGVL